MLAANGWWYGLVKADHYQPIEEQNLIQPLLTIPLVSVSFLSVDGAKFKIMKWIIVFIYWLITWVLKYIINFFELIWHLDTKHFSYYGTHFLTIKNIKETEIEISMFKTNDGFNFIERVVYWCVGK